jgi:hypothetical protein
MPWLVGLLALVGACGGVVHVTLTNDAGSTGAGPAGAAGSESVDASMPSLVVTSPKIETVLDACHAMCSRLAAVNCMRASCVTDCQKAQVLPQCADLYVKFLSCAVSKPFVCDNGVADLMGACASEKNEFLSCRWGILPMPLDAEAPPVEPPPVEPPPVVIVPEPTPTYPDGGTTACLQIPLVPDVAMCSWVAPPVQDAGDEVEAQAAEPWPYCSRTCSDGKHKWFGECIGGKCICRYDADVVCTCPQRQYECNVDCCF